MGNFEFANSEWESIRDYYNRRVGIDPPKWTNLQEYQRYLHREADLLDGEISRIQKEMTRDDKVDAELERLEREADALNRQNTKGIEQLRLKVLNDFGEVGADVIFNRSSSMTITRQKTRDLSCESNIQMLFLKLMVYQLEVRQISQSIKRLGTLHTTPFGG